MKKIFESRLNIILVSCLAALCVVLGITTVVDSNTPEETIPAVTVGRTFQEKIAATDVRAAEVKVDGKNAMHEKIREDKKKLDKKSAATEPAETKAPKAETSAETRPDPTESTEPQVHIYATAAPAASKASYDAQWNAGYLVAIDNPDKSYSCPHIELSDDNRELLERLCMGEYGDGGFTGAALIAQSVKNAMHTYGISSVADVISQLHYTGRTDRAPTDAVRKAVVYVFDMDMDAVQHRIMYMYNPELLSARYSDFHEKCKYICNYGQVRFFDR